MRSIERVFGAIIFTAVFCVIILYAWSSAKKTIYESPVLDRVNAYFEKSGIAKWKYDKKSVNLDLPLKVYLPEKK